MPVSTSYNKTYTKAYFEYHHLNNQLHFLRFIDLTSNSYRMRILFFHRHKFPQTIEIDYWLYQFSYKIVQYYFIRNNYQMCLYHQFLLIENNMNFLKNYNNLQFLKDGYCILSILLSIEDKNCIKWHNLKPFCSHCFSNWTQNHKQRIFTKHFLSLP